jgi:hypothetical protein
MSWTENHNRSTTFASQAQVFKWQGETEAAKEHYALAAEAETHALQALDPKKTRTLGITAVSATALWFKAEEFSKAKQVAYRWLASEKLPPFAVVQLEEILREILLSESAVAV